MRIWASVNSGDSGRIEEENTRLKRLVADLSLDKHMLSEALRKKSDARTVPQLGSGGNRDFGINVPEKRRELIYFKDTSPTGHARAELKSALFNVGRRSGAPDSMRQFNAGQGGEQLRASGYPSIHSPRPFSRTIRGSVPGRPRTRGTGVARTMNGAAR